MSREERRENHEECNDHKARKYIKRVSGGEVWFCHNCGGKGFYPDGVQSPTTTVRNVLASWGNGAESSEQVVKGIQLPRDASSEIPTTGLGWLYRYYIIDDEIKKYNICYSERYNRLILPVYNDEGLIYWQGRSLKQPFSKENPKYLNIRQSGAKNVFFKIRCKETKQPETIVIVEDILSAIRVGRTYNSLALLGSYFPPTILNEFRNYSKILIYLDEDKWKESIKAATRFNRLTGKQFVVKRHHLDPKELCPDELKKFLEEV